eukprot:3533980-Amphidinium_carterae.1
MGVTWYQTVHCVLRLVSCIDGMASSIRLCPCLARLEAFRKALEVHARIDKAATALAKRAQELKDELAEEQLVKWNLFLCGHDIEVLGSCSRLGGRMEVDEQRQVMQVLLDTWLGRYPSDLEGETTTLVVEHVTTSEQNGTDLAAQLIKAAGLTGKQCVLFESNG